MVRGLITGLVLSVGGLAVSMSAAAAPSTHSPSHRFTEADPAACGWLESAGSDAGSPALADASDAMGEICRYQDDHDQSLLAHATRALSEWVGAIGRFEAADHQARFFRALAALEAEADLFATERNALNLADPALMLEPFSAPLPETALFTLEEATVPFLGPTDRTATTVMIAVNAPGYDDLFTIYFPRGSAHLTLAAEDMIALAAEAVRGFSEAEVWVAASPALTAELAFHRISVVQDILLQSDVPGYWIRIDDGGIDAIMNRPESLAGDTET